MAGRQPAERLLWRNASLLWLAQFVSATGDAVFMPCLVWTATATTHSETWVGFAVFFYTLPYLLVGPFAGAWVDRARHRTVMVLSDLLRAGLLLLLPAAAAALGGMTFGLIVGVGILLATFTTPFAPARDALLPTLIGRGSLARWNAVMQTSQQFAMIVGLCLAGLLVGQSTGADEVGRIERVIQLDGATFVISAALLLMMRLPRREVPVAPRSRLLADVRAGLRYAKGDPVVGALLLLTALDNLAIMGPAVVGAALLINNVFSLGAAHYAWFEGTMAAGMLLGSILLATRGRRWSMGTVVLWGITMDGVTYLPFLWIPDYPLSLAAIGLHGIFIPMIVVGRTSLLQRHVPPQMHGKVFALVNFTVLGMTAVSGALCGWIAHVAGVRSLFGLAGGFGALCGVVGFLLLRGRLDAVGGPED
jgi:MFS family permease